MSIVQKTSPTPFRFQVVPESFLYKDSKTFGGPRECLIRYSNHLIWDKASNTFQKEQRLFCLPCRPKPWQEAHLPSQYQPWFSGPQLSTSSCPIADMLTELLFEVFSHLSPSEYPSLCLVNKRLSSIAKKAMASSIYARASNMALSNLSKPYPLRLILLLVHDPVAAAKITKLELSLLFPVHGPRPYGYDLAAEERYGFHAVQKVYSEAFLRLHLDPAALPGAQVLGVGKLAWLGRLRGGDAEAWVGLLLFLLPGLKHLKIIAEEGCHSPAFLWDPFEIFFHNLNHRLHMGHIPSMCGLENFECVLL